MLIAQFLSQVPACFQPRLTGRGHLVTHFKYRACWALACLVTLLGGIDTAEAQTAECGCRVFDFDGDADVDQADFGHLQACLTGLLPITDPTCLNADLDGNGVIGRDDIDAFIACVTGNQIPAAAGDQDGILITEFLASNSTGLIDEDGDRPDWIELHNPCRPGMNLAGYHLTDDPADLTKWTFPEIRLGVGEYLVVFASGKDRHDSSKPLHTSFKLSNNGNNDDSAFLALVAPDGETIVSAYTYPRQLIDISFGRPNSASTVLPEHATVKYHVPTQEDAAIGTGWTATDYADAGWPAATTGLGFTSIPPYFTVTTYKATVTVSNLTTAESVISDATKQSWKVTETWPTINFLSTSGSGNFTGDVAFPGTQIGTDVNDFVVLATGKVVIPAAGEWMFGVNSDDGFDLRLTRGTTVFRSYCDAARSPADTLQVFNFAEAGVYDVRLVYFERGGGSEVELFAAPGYTFDISNYRLVGDVANGGLPVGALGGGLQTNISSSMLGKNASLWLRASFQIDDPNAYRSMQLRMKYEDGFVAYLNGHEVVRRNAPAAVGWDSAALADRLITDASGYVAFSLSGFMSLLQPGKNVLAVQGLNNAAGDGDFLLLPELTIAAGDAATLGYLPTPTPGCPNVTGYLGLCDDVLFGIPHGFYDASFQLGMSSSTAGSQIRYTLDGSTPTASTGTVYTGPITITKTSVVRAAAFLDGWLPSSVLTQTYLFVADVIQQSPTGQAPGTGWPTGSVNGQVIDYGMDPTVVSDARYSSLMRAALLAVPSYSLVTDVGNLFDPAKGIYANSQQDGQAWERPASVELLNPDGQPGFQINAGVRIRGGYSRSTSNPKHSFRIFFRSEYGASRLDYPLFGTEGASEFSKIDFATAQNYSWSFEGNNNNYNTFLRDVFSRDAQREMGDPYTRSRYCHLYIDGVYWGLYYTQERPEADYAATYFGGSSDDYDVIKVDRDNNYYIYATNGDMDAWRRVYQLCGEDGVKQWGGATNDVYQQLLGCNPDGSRNPGYEVYLDIDNLIDYMLCSMFTADPDGPVSEFLGDGKPNNLYMVRDRNGFTGFKFFRHDAEHTLGSHTRDPNESRLGPYAAGQTFETFNPFRVHQDLAVCSDYRARFADRVYKMMFNGGPFTTQPCLNRIKARRDQMDTAIIAESARWGDAKREPARNRIDDWLPEVNWILNTYLPNRTNVVVQQFRDKGWFRDPPVFSKPGGNVAPGTEVVLSFPAGTGGTIYYTLDGTDPRRPGGIASPQAQSIQGTGGSVSLVAKNSTWRYLDNGTDQGTAWTAVGFNDSSWKGPQAARLGYGGDGETSPALSYGSQIWNKYITYYFRRSFSVGDTSKYTGLKVRLLRDDGGVVYINGTKLPLATTVTNMPTTFTYKTKASSRVDAPAEQTYFEGTVDLTVAPYNTLLRPNATNVVAVEIHQNSGGISDDDIGFDLELIATQSDTTTGKIVVNANTRLKARVLDSTGEWSAMNAADYLVGPVPLYINEVMAANATGLEDPDEPGEYPDWFEIYNPNPFEVDLGGMYVTDDLNAPTKWQLPRDLTIHSGEYLPFYADSDPTQGPRHVDFKLDAANGEAVGLFDRDGVTQVDAIQFGPQPQDVSIGRCPDGTGGWSTRPSPTPGAANCP